MEAYDGRQFVGINLHRRRSVIVRTTEAGEVLEAVRIVNDVERLASVMARAGWCGTGPSWSGCALTARLEVAVLAKCGVQVLMSDLFGLAGTGLLDRLDLPAPYSARIGSLRRLMDDLEFEINLFAGIVRGRMGREPGYTAVQNIPAIGPTLAAVFVA